MSFPPVFRSLPAACEAAIRNGNTLANIKVAKWAETYRCGVEDVKLAWEKALSAVTRKPQNNLETHDD